MSFRGRDMSDGANTSKLDLNEPRRFGGHGMDDKGMGEEDDRRFDSGRGRRPPFGRGRRQSPPGRDRLGFNYGRDDMPMMRDRSPLRGQEDRFSDNFKRDDMDHKDSGRAPYFGGSDRFMDSRSKSDGGFNSRFEGSFKSRSMNYPSGPAPKPHFDGFPKPNECEIIAVSKQQRSYAESVEARIKNVGILVDVLFLKDEALLTQTVDDIARRGSLYAMVINPQNQTHGSVTVNILHGTPQEHRNMPLEDALKLVARNFHEYVRSQRERMERERAERGQYTGAVAADREVQFLLRMLADGRWVSATEINAVIRYLTERRNKIAPGAAGPEDDRELRASSNPAPVDVKRESDCKPKEEVDVAQKEQDLQNRIMNLMNQGAPQSNATSSNLDTGMLSSTEISSQSNLNNNNNIHSNALGSTISGLKSSNDLANQSSHVEKSSSQSTYTSTATRTGNTSDAPSSTSSTFINFDHTVVQKALDNLIQSGPNILKSISLSNANMSESNTSQNSLPVGGSGGANKPAPSFGGSYGNAGGSLGTDSVVRSNMGNMNSRGPAAGMDMMGSQNRNPMKGMSDFSGPRGPSPGMGDLSGPRGLSPGMGNYGGPRGMGPSGGMSDRSTSDMSMGGQQRGGYDSMGGSMRGYGGGMSDNSGPPRSSDMGGRISNLGSAHNMGTGVGNFPTQNQYGGYKGPNQQQAGFPGGYNANSMLRPNYGGGGQGGMGGPRRY